MTNPCPCPELLQTKIQHLQRNPKTNHHVKIISPTTMPKAKRHKSETATVSAIREAFLGNRKMVATRSNELEANAQEQDPRNTREKLWVLRAPQGLKEGPSGQTAGDKDFKNRYIEHNGAAGQRPILGGNSDQTSLAKRWT